MLTVMSNHPFENDDGFEFFPISILTTLNSRLHKIAYSHEMSIYLSNCINTDTVSLIELAHLLCWIPAHVPSYIIYLSQQIVPRDIHVKISYHVNACHDISDS